MAERVYSFEAVSSSNQPSCKFPICPNNSFPYFFESLPLFFSMIVKIFWESIEVSMELLNLKPYKTTAFVKAY